MARHTIGSKRGSVRGAPPQVYIGFGSYTDGKDREPWEDAFRLCRHFLAIALAIIFLAFVFWILVAFGLLPEYVTQSVEAKTSGRILDPPAGIPREMRLIPKTQKGKNKLREAGTDQWDIVRKSDSVPCLGGEKGLLLRPRIEDEAWATLKVRWVHRSNDPDFDFQE